MLLGSADMFHSFLAKLPKFFYVSSQDAIGFLCVRVHRCGQKAGLFVWEC